MEVFYVVTLSSSSVFYVVPGPIVVFNGIQLRHCYHCYRSTVFLQPFFRTAVPAEGTCKHYIVLTSMANYNIRHKLPILSQMV